MYHASGSHRRDSPGQAYQELQEGETRIALRCADCRQARTLADALGTREGLRAVVGHEEYANARVPVEPDRTRPHTRLENRAGYMPPRGEAETFGEWLAAVEAAESRVRFRCHRKCGAVHLHKRAKLEAAFVAAVDRGRSAVYVPTDL